MICQRRPVLSAMSLFIRATFFVLLAAVGPLQLLAQSQPPAKPSPAKPSLDALIRRVNSYWSLLEKGRKSQALEYVAQSSREDFLAQQAPVFSKPRVTGLDLSDKPEEVKVTVTVTRMFPQIPNIDWPVTEKWVFTNGSWFAVLPKGNWFDLLAVNRLKQAPALSPQEIEQRQKEVQTALHFDSQTIDFGTVRKGKSAQFELKYDLSGSEPMEIRFKDLPPDVSVLSLTDRKLKPGSGQSVLMQWMTQNYDGALDAPFTILVKHRDVEVPYPFEIKGIVYSPLSSLPAQILLLKGETQKEFIVRNNSKSEVRLNSVYSQSGNFNVGPLPLVLPPGGQANLNLRETASIGETNYRDIVSLALDHPVEDMVSLIIPVVVNYEKPPEKPSVEKQLQDLLKKTQLPPTKP